MTSILALIALGCTDKSSDDTGEITETDDSGTPTNDADGDGFAPPDDCDDSDPAVNPDADEVCDGIDNDCSGAVDDNPTDGQTFYTDGDKDGYGDDSAPVTACEAPAGTAVEGGDCNDSQPGINPGAQEVCDDEDIDEDCDDLADDADPDATGQKGPTVYPDGDLDGFGDDSAKGTMRCDPSKDFVEDNTDCDDTDPTSNPKATEVCDETDNDCDSTIDFGMNVPGGFKTVQAAIDAAKDGDHICVAGGKYLEQIDFAGKDIVVEGSDGAKGTTLALDKGKGQVVRITGNNKGASLVGFTVTGGDDPEGAGIFVDDATVTLRDLIVTGNVSTYSLGANGIGVRIADSTALLDNVEVSGNSTDIEVDIDFSLYGGGVYADDSDITIRDSSITGNQATCTTTKASDLHANCDVFGVGLYAEECVVTLENVELSSNFAELVAYVADAYGGGFRFFDSEVEGTGVWAEDNQMIVDATSSYAHGAGGATSGGSLELNDFSLDGNTTTLTTDDGYPYGTGAGFFAYTELDLSNGQVVGNTATVTATSGGYAGCGAGGIEAYDYSQTDMWLSNLLVADNYCEGTDWAGSGGMYLRGDGTWTLENLIVTGNSSVSDQLATGGGLQLSFGSAGSTITNADFVGNTASGTDEGRGGAVANHCYGSGISCTFNNVSFVANDVSGKTAIGGAMWVDNEDRMAIRYSNFYDNGKDPYSGFDDPTGSDGNISVDPMYADTSAKLSQDWDLSLDKKSQCIDAGDPKILDVDKSTSDIGAYGGPLGASW